jgi:peptidoglycan/LPS O-acetylase OafA/YrhL
MKNRIPGLDGVRAIAFLLVYVSHAGFEKLIPGGLGVTIFFFLSGFLITTLLRLERDKSGQVSIRKFYLRRTLRIFPPMYITLFSWATLAAAGILIGTPHWKDLLLASSFLSNYSVALLHHRIAGGMMVMWSLAVEEHFYLLFPWMFVFFTARKFSVRAQVGTLAVLCALCLVWRTAAFAVLHQEAVYFHTDTRFDSILFGCILAIAMNPVVERVPAWLDKNIGWLASLGLGLIGATIALRSNVFRETLRYSVQGVALGPIMLFVLLRSKGWLVRALEHPVMTFLGRRSYAMYLIHLCLLETISTKLGISMRAACLAAFPLVLGYAQLMYVAVESPAERLKQKLTTKKASRPAMTAAAHA